MKRIFFLLALFAALVAPSQAQISPSSTLWNYAWPAATATGVVGQYLVLNTPLSSGGPAPSYSIDVYVTGTVPSVCTFEVQSSPDGVVWSSGANSPSGDVSCGSTAVGASNDLLYSFTSKPVQYLRINIGTLTGADGTTKVKFFYTRARNAQ
jgi:hypothetical protein